MDKKIKLLKNSLMYQMSLGSRELFHSNVWAWLMEIDNNFIKAFFDDLDITQYKVVKVCREKYNRDITIWLERKNTNIDRFVYLVIENKIKTLPNIKQFEKYSEDLDGFKLLKAVFTGLTNPYFDEQIKTAIKGRKAKVQWVYLNYYDIATKIEEIALESKSAEIQSKISQITEYCDIIKNIVALLNYEICNRENIFSFEHNGDLRCVRLDSLFTMLKAMSFVAYIKRNKNRIPVSPSGFYLDIHQSYNNGNATIDVRFSNKKEESKSWLTIGVQIQGKQYRIMAERNSEYSCEQVYKEFEKNWFNIREKSHSMKKSYCSYQTKEYSFVYQYSDINDNKNGYEQLLLNIITDLRQAVLILNGQEEKPTMCDSIIIPREKHKNEDLNNGVKKSRRYAFGENFTVKCELEEYKKKLGYKVYNSRNQNIGIVYSCDDKRATAYGCCEICVYDGFGSTYGQWHIIRSYGGYIKYDELCKQLKTSGEIKIFVD